MRKIVLITIILFLGFVVICNGYAQKPSPYPIGFVFDITGPASNIGIPEKRAAEMEIEAINASGVGNIEN